MTAPKPSTIRLANGAWRDHLPLRGRWLELFAAIARVPFALFGAFLLAWILLFGLSIPSHNSRLERLERQVRDSLPHPAGSRLILRRSVVENLGATGNQCHFAVVELRKGGGSPESLRRFYAGKRLKDPYSGEAIAVELRLAPSTPDANIGAVDPVTRLTTPAERGTADYAVSVVGWSEPGNDCRCE